MNFCAQAELVILEPPYQRTLQEYLLIRSFKGQFDFGGFRAAAAHAARMPAARLPLVARTSGGGPGTVTNALNSGDTAWEYVGPNNLDVPYRTYYGVQPVAGRVNAVAYDPSNPKTIYAGSAAGGLFRSSDGGSNWSALSDGGVVAGTVVAGWPDLHVSSIAISAREPRSIYVGLGDFPGGLPYAGGIMRSLDGGATWINLGAAQFGTFAVSQILIDPDDPQILVVTTGRGPGREGQVWRSTDRGATWTAVVTTAAQWSGAAIGAASSTRSRVYYVAGTVQGSPRVAIIRRSTDRGATWTTVTAPTSGAETLFSIAASPVTPDTIYGLLPGIGSLTSPARGSIWRSKDQGANWTSISTGFPDGKSTTLPANYNWSQPGYDNFIACVRRAGKDVLYVGLIDIAMSLDGGATWASIGGPTYTSDAQTHNDQHGIAFHPTDANEFLLANDGGVYRGRFDPQKVSTSWESLNRRLPITMFYRAAFHPTNPNVMLGGTQDNASAVSTGDLQNWLNKGGGDGGGSAVSSQRPNIQYTSSQGFASPISQISALAGIYFYRTDTAWQIQGGPLAGLPTFQQLIPPFTGSDRQPFISDLTVDPGNSTVLYTGTQFLWRLDDTFPLGPWKWSKVSTTALSTGQTIKRIAVAPSDRNTIYTASSDGEVWASADRGTTWTRLNATAVGPCSLNAAGVVVCPPANALSVNPNDATDVLVGFSSQPLPSAAPATPIGTLFRVVAAPGATAVWTNVSGAGATALPNVPVNAVTRDPDNPANTFYVGTDLGVFMSDDTGTRWFDAGTPLGLPRVQVNDLIVVPQTRMLNAATFGRGLWRLNLPVDRPILDSIQLSPNATFGGNRFSASIKLNRAAPPTGVAVILSSSNPTALPVPDFITIPAAQTTFDFPLTAIPSRDNANVTITATLANIRKDATVLVRAIEVGRLVIEPSEITGSDITNGTVILNGLAPATGVTVPLFSDCAAARVPTTVFIPAGLDSGKFRIQTSSVARLQTCSLRAQLGATVISPLSLRPPALAVFNVTASGLRRAAYVELDRPAPVGGMRVNFESSSPTIVVPGGVDIAAGQRRADFTVTIRRVTRKTTVILSAWLGARNAQTQILTRTVVLSP